MRPLLNTYSNMRKIFILILLVLPHFVFADIDEDGFILYKKPLLPGFSFNQTETTTELIFRGDVIKTYKNEEFDIELLPHGPNEEPDCYNSLSKNLPSSRFKTLIWKDYLKDCFILRSDKILNHYLLLYSPSLEWNRVSLYDIRAKKYYHWILNTVLSYRRYTRGGLIFLSKNSHHTCNRTLSIFRNGALKKLIDNCQMSANGIPVKIHSFLIKNDDLLITYSPVNLEGNNYITSKEEKKYRFSLKSSNITQAPKPQSQTGTKLLLQTLPLQ